MRNKKLFWTVLFWIYLAVLFKITVFRSGFGTHGLFENGSLNLSLFTGYLPLLKAGNWDRFIYLFLGNIIWFVPFGMYLKWRDKNKSFLQIAFWGFLFSLMIECLQYAFGTGYSELDDLILNTLGAWLGAAAVSACGRIRLLIAEYSRHEG